MFVWDCMLSAWNRASALVMAAVLVVAPSRAQQPPNISDSRTGLPGVVRVPMLDFNASRVSVALDTGYGMTESQHGEGAHHRALGSVGLGVAPVRGVELGVRAGIRHDRHPADALGVDKGTTGQLSLSGRTATRLGKALQVGGDLALDFPGAEKLGDSLKNPSLDLRALIGWVPVGGVRSAGFLGFRFDRSSGVGGNAPLYREGDRLALGLSDFNAILVGTGALVPLGKTELLGELSADLLVGSGAPSASKSPLRADVGVRHAVSNQLWAELLTEFSLSSRPGIGPGSPLVPIEPRFTIAIGLRYRIADRSASATQAARIVPEPVTTTKVPVEPEPTQTAKPVTNKAQVMVFDAAGHPLSDAVVTLVTADGEYPLEFTRGSTFALDAAPVGRARLEVRADLMREWVKDVEITKDAPFELRVEMLTAQGAGQIRGLVRAFDGRPLAAHVRVEPGGKDERAGGNGVFSIDVAPGKYRVKVQLDGYQSQERIVEVGKNGVMVLNVDLQRGR